MHLDSDISTKDAKNIFHVQMLFSVHHEQCTCQPTFTFTPLGTQNKNFFFFSQMDTKASTSIRPGAYFGVCTCIDKSLTFDIALNRHCSQKSNPVFPLHNDCIYMLANCDTL